MAKLSRMILERKGKNWTNALEYYDTFYGANLRKQSALGRPDEELVRAAELVSKSKALDIGCGLGRNCLYLARNGFSVKAFDLSEVAVKYVRSIAEDEKLSLEVFRQNILEHKLECEYHLVNASYILDEFSEINSKWLIRRMQEATLPGGVNSIVVFAHGFQKKQRFSFKPHFYKPEELTDLYTQEDWKVISLSTKRKEIQNQPIPVIRLIVQKPSLL